MKKWTLFTLLLLIFVGTLSAQSVGGNIWMTNSQTDGDRLYRVIPQKGVLCYDITDANNVELQGFLSIDGIEYFAVRENLMYCNSFGDLLVLSTDFKEGVQKTIQSVREVFPSLSVPGIDPIAFLTGERARELEMAYASSKPIQGSMSRMVLYGNNLYIVNNDELRTYNAAIEDPATALAELDKQNYGDGIKETVDLETVYREGKTLALGTPLGMKVFDLNDPSIPNFVSEYKHRRSCDPVVIFNELAFITMRDGTDCRGGVNQMTIVNLSNEQRPQKIRDYPMSNPHGLAVFKNQQVIVADGSAGIKVLDSSDPKKAVIIAELSGFFAYDVIVNDRKDLAVVSTDKGLRLYNIANPKQPLLLKELLASVQK